MLSRREKNALRKQNIDNACRLLWKLKEAYGELNRNQIIAEVSRPRMRAMVLSIWTNGGVDFPDCE